jgi:mono/diheme cytochrome c family protein
MSRSILFAALVAVAQALPSASAAPIQDGKSIFMGSGCFACHGQFGGGGAGPALSGNVMLSVKQYVVARVLVGGGVMPSFANKLTDDEVAAVADYVRNSWGNSFGPVSAAEAANVRAIINASKSSSDRAPRK